jgi:hypothetical protein
MSESSTLPALVVGLRSSGSLGFTGYLNFEFIISEVGVIHGLNSFVDIVRIVENLDNLIATMKA